MSEFNYSQLLREFLASKPALPQLIREFKTCVELYLDAGQQLYCVFEAQELAPSEFGPYFPGQWKQANQVWNDAKRDVLCCGDRLAEAMVAEGHGQGRPLKRLLRLLNGIRRDGGNSGCPGGVKLADWTDIEARLQQLAMQAEVAANKDKSPARQAEGTGASPGPAEGKQAERKGKMRGKRPLEESNPLRFQIYDRIRREQRQPGEQYAVIVDRLKSDRDFVEQVAAAGEKLNSSLVRNALAFFDYRARKARKNQDIGPA